MISERERLRSTLSARGIPEDASARETIALEPPTGAGTDLSWSQVAADPAAEFLLREEIGRGGMATVWAAQQRALGREVAFKRAMDPRDPEAERALLREAIIAAQLEHPNIVPVHQLVMTAHGPAVVMKRIAGESWRLCIGDPEISLEMHLDIFLQALNAVGFAHSRGVIHRDIKPENVMIGDWGEVYLLDWGVAARSDDPPSDAIVGTPCYMAPEMAEGRADERTDVFLLGATLHEVLTGRPRHEGSTALDVLYAAMYVEPYPYPASVPDELAEICNRACARDPEARFPNVHALRQAVLRYREHRAASVLTEGASELLAALRREAAREVPGTPDDEPLRRCFNEARLAYEAALRAWPESPAAHAGLRACLETMIAYELRQRHVEAAEALYAMLRGEDAGLRQRIASLRAELERERARLLGLARDGDPTVGALGRTRAYLGMGIATALMTLALYLRRLLLPDAALSNLRLVLVGAAVLTIMAMVALVWRRFGTFNAINLRIAQISVSTLAVSFGSRLSGYLTDTAPERVLITDAFILGLGGIALAPFHRAGPWLAGLAFALALVGTVYPSVVDELFIALSLLVPAGLALQKRGKLRLGSSLPAS